MRRDRLWAALWRWAFVLGILVALEVLGAAGYIDALVIPQPTDVAAATWDLIRTEQFGQDLRRTAVEVGVSCVIGIAIGLLLGFWAWRSRLVAETLEPYLITLYAMPTMIFYPVLLALMGLGPGPIIVIATLMVIVPVTVNTAAGLRAIPPVLIKLGRSLDCSRPTLLRQVLLPAAIPLLMPGLKVGVIYAMVGAIAMEFILANEGLGYRIGELYSGYNIPDMWAYITVVMVLGMATVALLGLLERRVRRDMA